MLDGLKFSLPPASCFLSAVGLEFPTLPRNMPLLYSLNMSRLYRNILLLVIAISVNSAFFQRRIDIFVFETNDVLNFDERDDSPLHIILDCPPRDTKSLGETHFISIH